MGIQLIHEAYLRGIEKMVILGTICCYPKYTPVPFKEEDLWDGYPEETNAPYGLAKKMLLVQSQAYRQQYGLNSIFLIPTNIYGPGDNFDVKSSHVIPALIRKISEAKDKGDLEITVWGTGKATREFIYVDDVAEAIILATKYYNKPDPINIGSSQEISIKELLRKLVDLIGYESKICWDHEQPDGQPRRKVSTIEAEKQIGFNSVTNLSAGLKKTVDWFCENTK